MLASALGWASPVAAAPEMGGSFVMAPDVRVRGMGDRVLTLIDDAPPTLRACLLWTIGTIGRHFVLRILVDARDSDIELSGSIGHELHHALEVLRSRQITNEGGIASLYHRIGSVRGLSVETEAAIKVGDAVRKELRERGAEH